MQSGEAVIYLGDEEALQENTIICTTAKRANGHRQREDY